MTDRLRYRWRSGTGGGHWRARGRGVRGACAAHARHRRGQDPSCWTLDRICHSSESCSTPLEADGRDGVRLGQRQLNRSAALSSSSNNTAGRHIAAARCIVRRHPGRGAGEVATRSPQTLFQDRGTFSGALGDGIEAAPRSFARPIGA